MGFEMLQTVHTIIHSLFSKVLQYVNQYIITADTTHIQSEEIVKTSHNSVETDSCYWSWDSFIYI